MANELVSELDERAFQRASMPPAADSLPTSLVQPLAPDAVGVQGTPAQTTAAPSIQPTAVGGGAIAAVGTQTGPRLVAALSANPLSIAIANDAKSAAQLGRLLDLSIVLPINPQGMAAASGTFDYVGIRARVNALAFANGGTAYRSALEAWRSEIEQTAMVAANIESALRAARDPLRCATAIKNVVDARTFGLANESCDRRLTPLDDFHERIRVATEARGRAIAEADQQYLGFDLRADFGDPTFGSNPAARGTHLLGAIALGRMIFLGGGSTYAMLRGRAGVAYASLNHASDVSYAVDWGASLAVGSLSGIRSIAANVGLEGRHRAAGSASALVPTNFVDLRLGFTVPISQANSVGVAMSFPLYGSNAASFAVTGDWSLLFPDAPRKVQ